MKKKEGIIILGIVVVLAGIWFVTNMIKEQVKTEDIVTVRLNNKVILEFDITKDAEYVVEGLVSKVHIEVKGEMYRVHDVDCPDHLCEKQGWVRRGDPMVIVCLPNQIILEQKIAR